jgi:hypothetical protein
LRQSPHIQLHLQTFLRQFPLFSIQSILFLVSLFGHSAFLSIRP